MSWFSSYFKRRSNSGGTHSTRQQPTSCPMDYPTHGRCIHHHHHQLLWHPKRNLRSCRSPADIRDRIHYHESSVHTQSFLQDLKQSYQFKNKAPTLLEDHWGISNLSLVALFLVWQPCFQSAQNSLLTQFFGCQLVFLSSTFFEENTSSSPKFCLLKWSARHVKMVC